MFLKKDEVGVYAIGGLLEVGKNCYAIEYRDEIILIDFGSLFPDDSLLGIDAIIPDLEYLKENQDKIVGLFISHGHLDHIGGIPILLDTINLKKIYANGFAEGLIRKQIGNQLADKIIHKYEEDSVIMSKYFAVTFYRTNHSIPDSFGVVVKTPLGTVVHSGDFKFDLTPIGPETNYHKITHVAHEGVLLLMSDSTNSMLPGFTLSEKKVGHSIQNLFDNIQGRVIIASFASNIHRVKQIIDGAIHANRKVHVMGRSMENNVRVAREMGYIKASDEQFITANEIKDLPLNEVCILSTGSQGETNAALSRISSGRHRYISIIPGDTVIFSSSPIPGNHYQVNETINKLYKLGASVIQNDTLTDTHTSGHGAQGEQQLLLSLIKPKYFIPIHGEYHMLVEHKKTAMETGIKEENCFVLQNGDIIAFSKEGVRRAGRFNADGVMVKGRSVNEISNAVLRQRKQISENGLLSIVVTINPDKDRMLSYPVIASRGFVYMRDNLELTNRIKALAKDLTNENIINGYDKKVLEKSLYEGISSLIRETTERSPEVIPVVMETNEKSK